MTLILQRGAAQGRVAILGQGSQPWTLQPSSSFSSLKWTFSAPCSSLCNIWHYFPSTPLHSAPLIQQAEIKTSDTFRALTQQKEAPSPSQRRLGHAPFEDS